MQDAEKQEFAAKSLSYNLDHPQLKQMFQQELQAARDRPSQPSSSAPAAQESEATTSRLDASDAAGSQEAETGQPKQAATSTEGRLAQV